MRESQVTGEWQKITERQLTRQSGSLYNSCEYGVKFRLNINVKHLIVRDTDVL